MRDEDAPRCQRRASDADSAKDGARAMSDMRSEMNIAYHPSALAIPPLRRRRVFNSTSSTGWRVRAGKKENTCRRTLSQF